MEKLKGRIENSDLGVKENRREESRERPLSKGRENISKITIMIEVSRRRREEIGRKQKEENFI